jgi:hypothetical protein
MKFTCEARSVHPAGVVMIVFAATYTTTRFEAFDAPGRVTVNDEPEKVPELD